MKELQLRGGYIAKVDDEDYVRLKHFNYTLERGWPRRSVSSGQRVFLHDDVLGLPPNPNLQVHHIDRDRLNAQKSNLQHVTAVINAQSRRRSSTGFVGVTLHKQTGKFEAKIMKDGVSHQLGLYRDKVQAAKARDRKAKELFGNNCVLNFPDAND